MNHKTHLNGFFKEYIANFLYGCSCRKSFPFYEGPPTIKFIG